MNRPNPRSADEGAVADDRAAAHEHGPDGARRPRGPRTACSRSCGGGRRRGSSVGRPGRTARGRRPGRPRSRPWTRARTARAGRRGDQVDHPLERDPALGDALAVQRSPAASRSRARRWRSGRTGRRARPRPSRCRGGRGRGPWRRGRASRRRAPPTARRGPPAVRSGGEMTKRGAGRRIGVVVAVLGQGQVVRARLGRDADPGGLRAADLLERRGRGEVHDVDRRLRLPGEGERAGRRDRLDVRRPGRGVEARRDVAARQRVGDGRVEEHGVLAVDLEHPAVPAHRPHRLEQLAIAQPEVEDHERLGGGDAGIDGGRELGDRVVRAAADDEASPTSTALSPSVAARHSRMPVRSDRSAAGDEPVPGLLNERNVVVPPNAAATESWKNRSGWASVATRVWVWTSTAPGSTSSPVASITSAGAAPPGRPGRARPPRSRRRGPRRPPAASRLAVTTVPPRTTRSVTRPR